MTSFALAAAAAFVFAGQPPAASPIGGQTATNADNDQLTPAPPLSTFEARLEAIDARIGQVTQLRARFEQRKRTPLLKKPMESSGTVLVKGDRLRWDTEKPAPLTLVADASEMRVYYPEARVVEVYSTGSKGDLRVISGHPLPRLSRLKEQFTLREIDPAVLGGSADRKGCVAAELLPISDELKSHMVSVRVLLDTTVPCIRKLVMTDRDDETTEIEFKDVRPNAEVRDDELKLTVPEGTRVSRPQGTTGANAETDNAKRGDVSK